uniref:Putative salivary kunitz domain protein n=1 Tax=Ixodes ricinus TaxID=34613 RepID=A0A0K8RFZ0_IXORI
MQKIFLWIFVAAALGVCKCHNTCDDSESDSAVMEKDGRCKGPPASSTGRMSVHGYFYDQSRDECRPVIFGDGEWNEKKNKFKTLQNCRETCRSHVPLYCFTSPEGTKSGLSYTMFTYNSSRGLCVNISSPNGAPQTNVFRTQEMCNKTCRDAELGKCAPSAVVQCRSQEQKTSYSYNDDSQTCEKAVRGKCGPFDSLDMCYERCGRYIKKKCNMPLLTSKYCDIKEKRYWYNATSQQCEEIEGCEDDILNFKTAKACWVTCSSSAQSRCLMRPDKGALGKHIGYSRSYYDIDSNTCKKTRQANIFQKVGKTNLFFNQEDCEKHCKPVYKGSVSTGA